MTFLLLFLAQNKSYFVTVLKEMWRGPAHSAILWRSQQLLLHQYYQISQKSPTVNISWRFFMEKFGGNLSLFD